MQDDERPVSTMDRQYLVRDMAFIFTLSSIVCILLRSPLWYGDGIRWLNVVVAPTFPTEGGGNRHFLFPYQAWIVYHAASALPFLVDSNSNDPTRAGVIAIVQGWNALMAGASLAVLYAWLRCFASRSAAAVGVTITALAGAFVMHATNMTEPMSSWLPALLAVYLVTRFAGDRRARLAAGLLIGLAGAFYIISASALVAVALIVGLHRNASFARRELARGVFRVAEVAAVSGVVFCAIFSIPQLLAHRDESVGGTVVGAVTPGLLGMYGHFGARHLVGAIAGFANALCSLPSMTGLSGVFLLSPWAIARTFGTMALAVAFLFGASWTLYRARSGLSADGRWTQALAAFAWLLVVYAIAVYFLAMYDKIWLFSLPPLSLLTALSFDVRQQNGGLRRALLIAGPGLLLVFLDVTLIAFPRRFAHNYDLDGALRLASLVQPNDLVVVHGWEGPSVYATGALTRPLTCVRMTDEAVTTRFQAAEISRRLAVDVQRARSEGGHVYFLGLLDQSAEEWQIFFGSQMHLPYTLLDPYRRSAVARAAVPGAIGAETLFEVVDSSP